MTSVTPGSERMHPLAMPQPAELIVSHDHADFDALAAQVAATKLHPAATMALAPAVGRSCCGAIVGAASCRGVGTRFTSTCTTW